MPFGDAHEYDSGISVSIGTPQPITPSKNAIVGGEPEFVSFDVTLKNGSDAAFAPGEVFVTVESGGEQAAEIRDPKNGLEGPPRKSVAPGAMRTWDLGFGVFDATDLAIQVQLGLDEEPVVFRVDS
jgi:hypothetical protein